MLLGAPGKRQAAEASARSFRNPEDPRFFFFFSMKALRKHLVVDIGLTIRTESVSLGLSCRQDIFIVTVFHTGKSEAGGISVVK